MSSQNVISIDIDLSKIRTKKDFLKEVSNKFRFPNYFNFNTEGMNECMRDLNWFKENYINAVFLNLEKIDNKELRGEIEDDLKMWKNYWENAELYQDYKKLHPIEKTVVITF